MKWKCHNCGNVFDSEDGSEKDEFDIHVFNCFDLDNFFEVLEK